MLAVLAGCYDQQVIQLDVTRSDDAVAAAVDLSVTVCAADNITVCNPDGSNAGYLFKGSSMPTDHVHIVVNDGRSTVLLKLETTSVAPQCKIVTFGSELITIPVDVTSTSFVWPCDPAVCVDLADPTVCNH